MASLRGKADRSKAGLNPEWAEERQHPINPKIWCGVTPITQEAITKRREAMRNVAEEVAAKAAHLSRLRHRKIDIFNMIDLRFSKRCANTVPNEVRAAQINAAARTKEGGYQKHIMHTNRPNEFRYHDISVAGMDIAMPHHDHIEVCDIQKREAKTLAETINDFAIDVALIRHKPTLAGDVSKASMQGVYMDTRTLLLNGDYKEMSPKAENSETIQTYRRLKAEHRKRDLKANNLEKGSKTTMTDLMPRLLDHEGLRMGGLLPDTPIYPVEMFQDILSPNQDAFSYGHSHFVGAGSAVISNTETIENAAATRQLQLALSPADAYGEHFVPDAQERQDRAEALLQRDDRAEAFKVILDTRHASKVGKPVKRYGISVRKNEAKRWKNLSAHNFSSIADSDDRSFVGHLYLTSGRVFHDQRVKKGDQDAVQKQSYNNATLAHICDPSGEAPMRNMSRGHWQNIKARKETLDTLSLSASSPY